MKSESRTPVQEPETVLAPGPLFMVSMGRSGSTLLYALLNKHPQVALMFEADLVCLRSAFLKPRTFCDWAERGEFRNDAFRRHGLDTADVGEGVSDFIGAFTATHQLFAQRKGAKIWGDKSPSYHDSLNRMADDFPHARFIIVWRNPKDTANAVLRAAAKGSSHFNRKGAVLRELLDYEVLKNECDRLLARGKPVCQVNYEDLILDTPSVMRQVCEFLQIPYDDSLSNLEGADRSAIYGGPNHINVRSDKIVQEPRPDHLDPALKAKIRQYVALWHQRYGAEWPPYPRPADNNAQPPNLFSRLIDSALNHLFRARDRISWIASSFIPISLLRHYRDLKQRHRGLSQYDCP
jgi:Sulfotransferase family